MFDQNAWREKIASCLNAPAVGCALLLCFEKFGRLTSVSDTEPPEPLKSCLNSEQKSDIQSDVSYPNSEIEVCDVYKNDTKKLIEQNKDDGVVFCTRTISELCLGAVVLPKKLVIDFVASYCSLSTEVVEVLIQEYLYLVLLYEIIEEDIELLGFTELLTRAWYRSVKKLISSNNIRNVLKEREAKIIIYEISKYYNKYVTILQENRIKYPSGGILLKNLMDSFYDIEVEMKNVNFYSREVGFSIVYHILRNIDSKNKICELNLRIDNIIKLLFDANVLQVKNGDSYLVHPRSKLIIKLLQKLRNPKPNAKQIKIATELPKFFVNYV